jgi:hypothetical protein
MTTQEPTMLSGWALAGVPATASPNKVAAQNPEVELAI